MGDFWADHDEDIHGRIADLEDEFPEGFIYECCNQTGDTEGCVDDVFHTSDLIDLVKIKT